MEKKTNEQILNDIKENLSEEKHLVPVYSRVRKQLDNGSVVDDVELVMVDRNKPFTPQSGIDTKIGDLAFAISHGQKIETSRAYLSKVRSGNPFDLKVLGDQIETTFNNFKEIKK